ncbi:MAG: glycosyltransferase family 4 protein [Candidatus Limnocylindrales bacterium]
MRATRRAGCSPSGSGQRRPVCIVVHAYYDEDPRVRRQAEALVGAGRPVDVFALRRPGDLASEVVDGVNVHRLPVQRHQGADLSTYLREYLTFFGRVVVALLRSHPTRRFAVAQVASIPDFLIFAALPLRVVGVPLVLDLHEAMPEMFRSRFPRMRNRLILGLVDLQERLAIRAADAVLTANHPFAERLHRIGTPAGKVTVILNSPALQRFDRAVHPERPFMADETLRLVYTGALTPIYELDVLLEAASQVASKLGPEQRVELHLYGRGDSRERLERRAAALGIADRVFFHGRIPLEEVAGAIAAADLGIAPTRADRFTEMTMSTKIFEYAIMGKPVVASRLKAVERYFPPESLPLYRSGDSRDLARAILTLVSDPAERDVRNQRTERRVRELGWEEEARRYVGFIEDLADDRVSSRP